MVIIIRIIRKKQCKLMHVSISSAPQSILVVCASFTLISPPSLVVNHITQIHQAQFMPNRNVISCHLARLVDNA